MIDELIYHEYAGWKLEYNELLENLKTLNSPLYSRVETILNVLDFLYDKLIDDPAYSEEEDQIFETGFQYVYDQIRQIDTLLKDIYKGDVKALNDNSKEINLLLNTVDFENELLSAENLDPKSLQFFLDFEQEILAKLSSGEPIEDSYYEKLDIESQLIFKKHKLDFYPIETIFLEIADELGII